jgi:hypothetical protein
VPVKASGRTLRTQHSGLRADSVARVKCSTSQGRPTGSAENIGGPQQDNRSGENQAWAAVSLSSTSDGEWHRDVKVGRGGERSQVGESPPVLLGEASSRQPKGRGPAPPLGNERMLGLKITEGLSNGCLIGEPSEDVCAEFGAAGLVSESKGLDQVALRKSVLPVVVRHPTDEVELFRAERTHRSGCH